jgi:hypothetical protein
MSSSKSAETVALSGLLTIGTVSAARAALLASFERHDTLLLRIGAESDADIAGIQLVLSARDYARTNSKTLALAEPAAGTMLEVLRRGGFLEDPTEDDRKFWLHEETVQ